MNSELDAAGGPPTRAAVSPGRSPANIEITLFGFLISLTLKVALDTAYGSSLIGAKSISDLLGAVSVPASWLVLVFMVTLLRFVYGAYRINDEVQNTPNDVQGASARFWNLIATLVLFVLFYATGLSVRHARPFFIALLAIHAWDFVWLVSMAIALRRERVLRNVMSKFIVIDTATVALLAFLIWYFPDHFRGKAVVLMIALAVADFIWNANFFFHARDWRSRASEKWWRR